MYQPLLHWLSTNRFATNAKTRGPRPKNKHHRSWRLSEKTDLLQLKLVRFWQFSIQFSLSVKSNETKFIMSITKHFHWIDKNLKAWSLKILLFNKEDFYEPLSETRDFSKKILFAKNLQNVQIVGLVRKMGMEYRAFQRTVINL